MFICNYFYESLVVFLLNGGFSISFDEPGEVMVKNAQQHQKYVNRLKEYLSTIFTERHRKIKNDSK